MPVAAPILSPESDTESPVVSTASPVDDTPPPVGDTPPPVEWSFRSWWRHFGSCLGFRLIFSRLKSSLGPLWRVLNTLLLLVLLITYIVFSVMSSMMYSERTMLYPSCNPISKPSWLDQNISTSMCSLSVQLFYRNNVFHTISIPMEWIHYRDRKSVV